MYLPCRHHIFEIVLGAVFDHLSPPSTGPSIGLFEQFSKAWDKMDKTNFKSGLHSERVASVLEKRTEEIESFIQNILSCHVQPRDDYRELLLLCLIFLNKISPEQVKFYKPGAVSRARWMAKAIYCLKIFLFREEFPLRSNQLKALTEICLFIVTVYIQAWYTAPCSASAPSNDLKFIKALIDYDEINSDVAKVARSKICRHLWYLGTETVAMAFFSEEVSLETKRKMVASIQMDNYQDKSESDRTLLKRYYSSAANLYSLKDKDLDYFINNNSIEFFERFNINTSVFNLDVSHWETSENYKEGLEIVRNLRVVNDVAERGVKLMLDYKDRLTCSEEQRQYAIQLVEQYNTVFKTSTKENLMQPMEMQ